MIYLYLFGAVAAWQLIAYLLDLSCERQQRRQALAGTRDRVLEIDPPATEELVDRPLHAITQRHDRRQDPHHEEDRKERALAEVEFDGRRKPFPQPKGSDPEGPAWRSAFAASATPAERRRLRDDLLVLAIEMQRTLQVQTFATR